MTSLLTLIVLAAPLAFLVAAAVGYIQSGSRPRMVERTIRGAAIIGLFVAAAGAVLTVQYGTLLSPTWGWNGLGPSIRLDPLSVVMFCMISLLAILVVQYSVNYLAGDDRQGVFFGWLVATIAAVELLMVSGNLVLLVGAWIAMSLSLHRLLAFYPQRPDAVVAARKKFVATRTGDAFLIAAAMLLYAHCGTGDLEQIFAGMEPAVNGGLGPIFSNTSCESCHPANGRSRQILAHISRPSLDAKGRPQPVEGSGPPWRSGRSSDTRMRPIWPSRIATAP